MAVDECVVYVDELIEGDEMLVGSMPVTNSNGVGSAHHESETNIIPTKPNSTATETKRNSARLIRINRKGMSSSEKRSNKKY